MKKYFISFLLLIWTANINSSYSQSGWFWQNSGTSYQLNSIFAVNSNIAFVAGATGTILKTTNGGTNWINYNLSPQYFFWSIRFINANTGIAVGGYSSSSALIIKTTNGGMNWIQQYSSANITLRSVYLLDENIAISSGNFGGSNGYIIRTSNGGSNWNIVFTSAYTGFNNVNFYNKSTGYIASNYGIFKSIDTGKTWVHYDAGTNYVLYDVFFTEINIGYAVGIHGTIMKSTNSGVNWFSVPCGSYITDLYSLYFMDSNTGTTVGSNGSIFRTTDGGNNWLNQTVNSISYLGCVYFVDINTGFTVGRTIDTAEHGIILKTTTGGNPIGIQRISSEIPNTFQLSQNYPNPFNPTTKIKFDIPPLKGVRGMGVRLIISDLLGREVTTLINEQLKPGTYEVEFDGTNYPSGVYFYKLKTNEYSESKKMVLIK